jgi:hypothetical protein
MRETTKEEFKEIYFRLGGGEATGWSLDYWNTFFERNERPGMRYLVEEPETPDHTRMMIVTDYVTNEYRLWFWTEEGEESFFDFPDDHEDSTSGDGSPRPMPTVRPAGWRRPARVPFAPRRGGGWLAGAPLLWFFVLLAVVDKGFGGLQSRSTVVWILAASFVLSAAVALGLTCHTIRSGPRKELEIRTGRDWVRRPTHSLFWLRSEYWALGYLVVAVACALSAGTGR